MPRLIQPESSNLIIQIRGTSGSGKTTVMRAVMKAIPALTNNTLSEMYVPGRKKPLYYTDGGSVSIVGSYESTCGGCDTIQGYDLLMSTVRSLYDRGNVLMEGLLLSEDVKQTLTLLPRKIKAVFLTTPVDECIKRVKGRRLAAGNEKPLKEDNTRRRVDVIRRAQDRLEAAGVDCYSISSDKAPELILKWLKG